MQIPKNTTCRFKDDFRLFTDQTHMISIPSGTKVNVIDIDIKDRYTVEMLDDSYGFEIIDNVDGDCLSVDVEELGDRVVEFLYRFNDVNFKKEDYQFLEYVGKLLHDSYTIIDGMEYANGKLDRFKKDYNM